jgi:hypothetical protein
MTYNVRKLAYKAKGSRVPINTTHCPGGGLFWPVGIVRLRNFEYCPAKVRAKLRLVCPHCGGALDPKLIKHLAGKVVGSIKGKAKARPSDVARAAVMKRWEKKKAAQEPPPKL